MIVDTPDVQWRDLRQASGESIMNANAHTAGRWFDATWNERKESIIDELIDPKRPGYLERRKVCPPEELELE